MNATEVINELENMGYKVDTMHVAVGNIYRCKELDGWHWMYENTFIQKAQELLN